MTAPRPGWLTLDEALAIVCLFEHDKPERTPETAFAHETAVAVIRERAEQALTRVSKLLLTEANDED